VCSKTDAGETISLTAAKARQVFVNWVYAAWQQIPEELVRKGFKTCGITNALDGSEEHLCNIVLQHVLE
jgi:hypothetical protein